MESNLELPSPHTAAWTLWPGADGKAGSLSRVVDSALSGYFLYPELEWIKYGYRPPDSSTLLGAWRNAGGTVFIFLLAAPGKNTKAVEYPFRLYATGQKDAVNAVASTISSLKTALARSERKELKLRSAEDLLQMEKRSPAFSRWVYFMALPSIAANVVAVILRKFPTPSSHYLVLGETYLTLLILIQIASLILLLVSVSFGVVYMIRYGLLMLRRF